jgi:sterol 14-demethylase
MTQIFSEQKGMAKRGLTLERFASYTGVIEDEVKDFTKDWKDSEIDLFHTLAEMVIFTATHCLHGLETRNNFDAHVADLYSQLDGGFSALAWFFPSWVPFPSFRLRDKAHIELKRLFKKVINLRLESGNKETHDLLNTFMSAHYERVLDGRALTHEEVSGLLIALLMAGQHTSSTTSAWFGYFVR